MKTLLDHLDDLQPILTRRPLALFFDIDGTVSEIAPRPDLAKVSPRCRRFLKRLIPHLELIAVISGRPVALARRMVGIPELAYVGNHGLEHWQRGQTRVARGVARYREVVAEALQDLQLRLPLAGLVFENKGLTANIHYRLSPTPDRARESILKAFHDSAYASRMAVREAKRVVELRPPVDIHKGTAVGNLVRTHKLRTVLYLGDDRTDIDAFRALHNLSRGRNFKGVAVAVASQDTPREVLEAADFTLASVGEVERFFQWLVGELGGRASARKGRTAGAKL